MSAASFAPHFLFWDEARSSARVLALEADEKERARLAQTLALEHLSFLAAELSLRPWLGGVEITGRLRAVAGRICGLSLEPFDETIDHQFQIRLTPARGGSARPAPHVIDVDPPEDSPEEVEGAGVDLDRIIFEELALALDPWPRKPGAVFESPNTPAPESPFSSLTRLRRPGGPI
ncbi:MAG: YceD family protein [Caulobacteraceae bacterium]